MDLEAYSKCLHATYNIEGNAYHRITVAQFLSNYIDYIEAEKSRTVPQSPITTTTSVEQVSAEKIKPPRQTVSPTRVPKVKKIPAKYVE